MLFPYLLWLKNLPMHVCLLFAISEITLPLSLINLFLTYAVWSEEIRKVNTLFILVERTLLIIFISVLSSDISLQFLMNLLSLPFFSNIFTAACFWEVLNSWFRNDLWTETKNDFLTSSQKQSQNFSESPSSPGDLLFSIDFKLINTSSSDIRPLQLNVCSLVTFGKYTSIMSVWNWTLRENKDC